MKNRSALGLLLAVLAAALYAINIPLSKIFLEDLSPTVMASLLYLGAGVGMAIYALGVKAKGGEPIKEPLLRSDLPYVIAMVLLDIAAPILLMYGLVHATSANASLLNNFEVVATAIIAFTFFREKVSSRLWVAILLVCVASIVLTFEGEGSFTFNIGSLLVLAAASCWGLENNCTRAISDKSSVQIVIIKGLFSGTGAAVVAFVVVKEFPAWNLILAVMALGFVSYGMSINFYIMAQKDLGAAKTSAFYSIAPFLGVVFSFLLLGERPPSQFYFALAIMAAATLLIVQDTMTGEKKEASSWLWITHTHEHSHKGEIHEHEHRHFRFTPTLLQSHHHQRSQH